MGGIRFDLVAQLADIDMQVMRVRSIPGSPDLRKQHLASHNLACVVDERDEKEGIA